MNLKSFVFNPFYENTYVIWGQGKECAIVDPGCYENFEIEEITGFIQENGLQVSCILNTHCHIDHVLGNYELKRRYDCPLFIPENEVGTYEAVTAYSSNWGIHHYTKAEPDRLLQEGETISIGDLECKVLACSGHSAGHQIFYFESEDVLIGGDVLFKGSIGRTDLPGGNHDQLLRNIKEKVYTLPEETTVYPGHGPETSVGFERKHNPFVRA